MNDVVIRFENVTKKYKLYKSEKKRLLGAFIKTVPYVEKFANKDISFTITRGESVAIFGKNGAGKSTLLKLITEVLYPTEGTIEINGRVSALLELTAGFDPEFTGRENIYFKGSLMGLTNSEIKNYEPAIIQFADIEEYIDQPVRTYSSGMKARLGFAINSNINPEILIIDEALSVGDNEFKNKCKTKIDEISNMQHTTVLLVTHSTETAKEFCHRGIVLKKGALIFDGPIDPAIKAYNISVKPKGGAGAKKTAKKPTKVDDKPLKQSAPLPPNTPPAEKE